MCQESCRTPPPLSLAEREILGAGQKESLTPRTLPVAPVLTDVKTVGDSKAIGRLVEGRRRIALRIASLLPQLGRSYHRKQFLTHSERGSRRALTRTTWCPHWQRHRLIFCSSDHQCVLPPMMINALGLSM